MQAGRTRFWQQLLAGLCLSAVKDELSIPYQSRRGNTQQTSERPSRKTGCPGKEQGYLLAWDDKNENNSTSEQTGEINSASDEGSAGSLGVSGVARCGLFQRPPRSWKASPSRQQALTGPCVGPRETQVSGKEQVGSCVAYRAGANSSPRLRSHDLAELGRRGGYVDFMPAQAHRIATHRLATPRKLSGPEVQEASACYVLIYSLSQMGE